MAMVSIKTCYWWPISWKYHWHKNAECSTSFSELHSMPQGIWLCFLLKFCDKPNPHRKRHLLHKEWQLPRSWCMLWHVMTQPFRQVIQPSAFWAITSCLPVQEHLLLNTVPCENILKLEHFQNSLLAFVSSDIWSVLPLCPKYPSQSSFLSPPSMGIFLFYAKLRNTLSEVLPPLHHTQCSLLQVLHHHRPRLAQQPVSFLLDSQILCQNQILHLHLNLDCICWKWLAW